MIGSKSFTVDVEKTGSTDSFNLVQNGHKEGRPHQDPRSSPKNGFWYALKPDSFRRNPNARIVTEATGADGRPLPDQPPVEPALAMKLKQRHLTMIAIAGSIGTGLFIGSGAALAKGGPAAIVLAYSLVGLLLWCTVHALGELAVAFPVAGAFSVYSSRFIDPAWGFAMGWNYALQWLIVLPLEIVAASITLSFWEGARSINPAAFVGIFWLVIVMINMFGAKGYGEAEFVFAIVKILAVIGFIILGLIIACGGIAGQAYIGASYWHDPGSFNNGLKGVCSVFVIAAFSFAGTEIVGLTAAETDNPRLALPSAVKQVFWRITLFYLASLIVVCCLVKYTDPALLNGSGHSDANASPFVIAVRNAGISVVPSVMNMVILIAVLSVGNSSVYGSSRTLAALADRGQAPRILGYIDQTGRPIVSILLASCVGLLCFIVAAGSEIRTEAFNWMLAISGLSSIFTWMSICICHIRFRHAWKASGQGLSDLAFISQAGYWGSWLGVGLTILILVAQFWVGLAPVGYASMTTTERVENFFGAYLGFFIIFTFYFGFKVVNKTKFRRVAEMDVTSGRRDVTGLAAILAEEREARANWPLWKKGFKLFC